MDDEEINASLTPPKTPVWNNNKTLSGRVSKSRISPRKKAKKDYKKMEDPFVDLKDVTDENGEAMFQREKSESEDSYPTDVEFGQERSVKVESAEEAI